MQDMYSNYYKKDCS